EKLFCPVAHDAVSEWRGRLSSPSGARAREKDVPPPDFEAELARGGILRMHLRSEIRGSGRSGSSWLIQLLGQAAKRTLPESVDRLEAELAGLVDSIDSGVLVLDTDGRILLASDRLAAIFGFEPRHFQELDTIDALIDRWALHFLRP